MMAADRVIRWSTAGAVIGVTAVAAVASYEHAYELVRAHGEAGWTARMFPLTVDGLIYASSMVMLDSARRKVPVPALARWLLGLGIAATLAANVTHGLGHGLLGAAVAACMLTCGNGSDCATGSDRSRCCHRSIRHTGSQHPQTYEYRALSRYHDRLKSPLAGGSP